MSIKQSWINFLYNISTGTKKTRNLLTPIGVFIFGMFIFIFVFAAVYTDNILGLPKLNINTWNIIISVVFLIFGLFFVLCVSDSFFKSQRNTSTN